MKLSCDEATTICDKNQYKEASLFEKLKLSLHLLVCKKCGRYSKQNNIMSTCYSQYKNSHQQKKYHLTENDKKQLASKILKEIKQL